MNFPDTLAAAIRRSGTPAMVGLDPRAAQLPPGLLDEAESASPQLVARAYAAFCRGVIDAVAPLVGVVKPQAAFFEQLGPFGMTALAEVIEYAKRQRLVVVLDGKRNDIGSTARAYAEGWLGRDTSAWGADALTVSPYLGDDSLTPFVDVCQKRGAGAFVLVKTSNPGGAMLQDLIANERPLYEHVAAHVETLAAATAGECGLGAIGAVVGATYPQQLAELRANMPHAWLLVPGYGSQGGTAADVASAFRDDGLGAVVNNSRGIIFAHARPEYERFGPSHWQDAVAAATQDMIAALREATPAGKL